MDSWMALSEMPDWKDKAISLVVVMAFVVLVAVLGFVIRPNSLSYLGLAAFMVLLAGVVLWLYRKGGP
jgi:Na+-translocating ferredoxin:NAD+ oxidoreductase RnfA subunit